MKKSSGSSSSELRAEARVRDHELKVITDRIALVEKHFALFHKDMVAYCASLEGLRDKSTKFSAAVEAYAEEEFPAVRGGLQAVAENVATVQDYLSSQIDFLLNKVAQPLSLYTTDCKHARDYMKGTMVSRNKEIAKLKALDKVRAKDPNNKKIPQLEQELQKSAVDANRSRQTMIEQMTAFEKKKIEDIKTIFGNYFHGQMMYHAKALEINTLAFQNLMKIDEEQDLEAFQTALHPSSMPSRLDVVKYGSQNSLQRFGSQGSLEGSQLSLNRTNQSFQSQGTLNDTGGSGY
ncbi:CBY1-interacting BAR domain-containing protein 1 [Nematostella vectensis]|uniref:CBY1-interacting BAR domain-containing protein 1 n=1 Tax=Nematostella vectensis TaxID=45351 RepID=UPI00138FB19E|nr:CBY1-interacting BAR domain-containing protein 1 [Nematostella vectensis]